MLEFVECPMVRKRLTIDLCRQCPAGYHGGVMLTVQIERKDVVSGGCATSEVVRITEAGYPTLQQLHPADTHQLTVQNRALACGFPRQLPIEVVES